MAHLWISSTATDADVIVYLEEVDEHGRSTYISEGRDQSLAPRNG